MLTTPALKKARQISGLFVCEWLLSREKPSQIMAEINEQKKGIILIYPTN